MVVRKLVSVACLIVMLAALGFAQGASTGDLHITIRDPKGSLVTNATVTARDEAKGLERATSENTDGQYHILLLPPAQYTVTAEAPGFARATVPNVVITVGQMAELPIVLSVAGSQEVINVSSAAELVETHATRTCAAWHAPRSRVRAPARRLATCRLPSARSAVSPPRSR